MLGKMMNVELTVNSLIDHAARYHGDAEIVSIGTDGNPSRSDWATVSRRSRQLASALRTAGYVQGIGARPFVGITWGTWNVILASLVAGWCVTPLTRDCFQNNSFTLSTMLKTKPYSLTKRSFRLFQISVTDWRRLRNLY